MGGLRISPRAYERVTLATLAALAFIVVTGAAVRLTGSGLGCPDWPTCSDDRLVPPLEYHAMVEFVNRVVTGLVSAAVSLAVLGALLRVPRRADLVWLATGLVAGVAAQVMLGAATVLFHLDPSLVMGHFLVSMVLVATATVLHDRAGRADGAPSVPSAAPRVATMSQFVMVAGAVVIATGTVVTASGPHGGDEDVRRLGFFLPDVARVHGGAMVVFLTIVLLTLAAARRHASPHVLRRGTVLLGVLVAQAGVGYVQYFTGVPVILVAIHVTGAVAVWIAALRFHLGLTRPALARAGNVAPQQPFAAMAPVGGIER